MSIAWWFVVAVVVVSIVNVSNIINLTVPSCCCCFFIWFLHFPYVLCAFTQRFLHTCNVYPYFQRNSVHDCSFHSVFIFVFKWTAMGGFPVAFKTVYCSVYTFHFVKIDCIYWKCYAKTKCDRSYHIASIIW